MQTTSEQFEAAVRRGLGRAVLWLTRGEVVPDRAFISYACTHNLAYDRQTEDNRARYMFDIVQATGEPDFYARAVIQALSEFGEGNNEADDERSIDQMFDLLGLLAKSGDPAARQSLLPLYAIKYAQHSGIFGGEALVDTDGLEGYLFVVRQWLQRPLEEDDAWYETSLLRDVEERFGAGPVQAFMAQAASVEPAVGAYFERVHADLITWEAQRGTGPALPQPDYAALRQMISDTDSPFNRPRFWREGEKMSKADARQLASELLAETDPQRLRRYLHLFHRRAFPLDPTLLLALARSADAATATPARAALAQLTAPSVRALALELLETDARPGELIELLTLNFQPGDEAAIERVLQRTWDAYEVETVGRSIRRVFEKNLTPSAEPSLLLFYERGYCTMCRCGAIELLAGNGLLPSFILEEGCYDAYSGTRKLVSARVSR